MGRRIVVIGAAAGAALSLWAPGASALVRDLELVSRGGSETATISDGPNAHLAGFSLDGRRVLVETPDHLTPDDGDGLYDLDLFERFGGSTRLLSGGPQPSAEGHGASFSGTTPDARTVVMGSLDPLLPDDAGDGDDLDAYVARDGRLELVSRGFDEELRDLIGGGRVTRDGKRIFFTTRQRLAAQDADRTPDVYENAGGRLRLVSPDPLDSYDRLEAGTGLTELSEDGRVLFVEGSP